MGVLLRFQFPILPVGVAHTCSTLAEEADMYSGSGASGAWNRDPSAAEYIGMPANGADQRPLLQLLPPPLGHQHLVCDPLDPQWVSAGALDVVPGVVAVCRSVSPDGHPLASMETAVAGLPGGC